MKKILSILMLLVAIVTGAWATDLEVNVDQIRVSTTKAALVKIALGDNAGFSSGKLQVSSNKTGSFTISSTNTDLYKIKKVEFATNRAPVSFKCTDTDTDVTGSDKAWEYTPSSSVDNLTFSLKSSSSSTTATVKVTLTTASTYTVEKLSGFTLENRTFSFTSTAESTNIELTDVGEYTSTIGSPNLIQCGKSSSKTYGLKFAAKSGYNLKFISFYFYDTTGEPSTSNISPDKGTYTPGAYTWTGSAENVTFTIDNKNAENYKFYNIYVGYESAAPAGPSLSVDPAEADPFTYVVGNGPSDAQEFTVSLANSEKAVSATLSSTNYEMSKTENGTYSSDDITDLVDDDKVYVRLKAGLAKGTGYDGTLTFANDDVTADVVVDLSGSVTAQTYTVDYELNGGSGTAPQDQQEAGAKFNLAAAPTKDFSTFAGWLCDADNQVYAAGAEYEMTAKNTKFTAQWNVTTYSSTLDFAAETINRAVYGSTSAPTGEKAFTNINTFLESGNMIGTSGLNNSNWEPSDEKTGYIGYKLKKDGASVKFMAKSGKKVTITFGSIAANVTLKKNGTSSTIPSEGASGNQKQTVVSFDADEDMLVEIVTSSGGTVTLNKIAIEDAAVSTVVNVGVTGFATIGLPYVSTVPADVTAYTVTPTTSSKVTLSPVEAGATIPAYKGLIIVAEPGNYTFTQKITEGRTTYETGTGLLATGAVTRNSAATEGEFYYFAIIDSTHKKVGFKKCAEGATLAANKAYLPGALVPSGSNSSLEISFDGETAINGIAESEANAEAPVKVIKNGKLFIGNYNVAGARIK